MSQPSRVWGVTAVRLKKKKPSGVRGLKICVCWRTRFCRLVGENVKEIGNDDDGDVGENVTVGVMDSFECDHDLYCDISKGFVFPGCARHGHVLSSLERVPLGSTVHVDRHPPRDSTCPLGYSPTYPSHCRPSRPQVLASL